jgi:hypothetical protein
MFSTASHRRTVGFVRIWYRSVSNANAKSLIVSVEPSRRPPSSTADRDRLMAICYRRPPRALPSPLAGSRGVAGRAKRAHAAR